MTIKVEVLEADTVPGEEEPDELVEVDGLPSLNEVELVVAMTVAADEAVEVEVVDTTTVLEEPIVADELDVTSDAVDVRPVELDEDDRELEVDA